MTQTNEKLKSFHKELGKELCQEFECGLQTLVMDLFSGLERVFIDDEDKSEYLIHAFATIIDSTEDMIGPHRMGQLN